MGNREGKGMGISLRLLTLLVALLLVAGCAGKTKSQDALSEQESYYLNANLDFAIEHPHDWIRTKGGQKGAASDPYTVEWLSPAPPGEASQVRGSVTALPPSLARGGWKEMLEVFQSAHHGFVVTDRREIELPSGPALQVLGHTPQHTYMVVFLTSYRRAFTLSFSSPPEYFDRFRPAFSRMAESLTLLE